MKLALASMVCAIALGLSFSSPASAQSFYKFDLGHGRLGVSISDVTPELKRSKHLSVDEGVYVEDVSEDSPAEKAGIQEGDVIVKFNDRTIEDCNDLVRAIERTKGKTEAKIEVVRDKDHKTLTAKLDRRRAPRAFSWNLGNMHIPNPPRMPRHFAFHFNDRFEGLAVEDLTGQLADFFKVPEGRGVLVTEVEKGSAAEKAEFKAGDVITKLGKTSIHDIEDLRSEFDDAEGKSIPVQVVRNGKDLSLTLKLEGDDDDEEEDDSSLLIVPNNCQPSRPVLENTGSDLRHHILDRLMESLRSLEAQIKSRVSYVVAQIRATFAVSPDPTTASGSRG